MASNICCCASGSEISWNCQNGHRSRSRAQISFSKEFVVLPITSVVIVLIVLTGEVIVVVCVINVLQCCSLENREIISGSL